jgi:hypothetical protein
MVTNEEVLSVIKELTDSDRAPWDKAAAQVLELLPTQARALGAKG